MATTNEMPPGERLGFSVEADGVMRLRLDDGALVSVRPVVVDVVREITAEGTIAYFVQGTLQITLKEPPGEKT